MSAEVTALSDQELRAKLTAFGMDVGPILDSTRPLYQRKLAQLLTGDVPPAEPEHEYYEESPQPSPVANKSSPLLQGSPSPKVRTRGGEDFGRATSPDYVDAPSFQPSLDSSINLIRARKPISRTVQPELQSRSTYQPLGTPYPAANAQFKKTDSGNGSMVDHLLKFACFFVVILVVVYFVVYQEPGNAVETRTKV